MKKYRSEISAYIHEAAKDLQAIGLMDNDSMRELDNLCHTDEKKDFKPFSSTKRALSQESVALSM